MITPMAYERAGTLLMLRPGHSSSSQAADGLVRNANARLTVFAARGTEEHSNQVRFADIVEKPPGAKSSETLIQEGDRARRNDSQPALSRFETCARRQPAGVFQQYPPISDVPGKALISRVLPCLQQGG
jgi:hypothetical protein